MYGFRLTYVYQHTAKPHIQYVSKIDWITSSVRFLHQDKEKSHKRMGGIWWILCVTNYYFQQKILSNILHKTDNNFTVQFQNLLLFSSYSL